MNAGMPIPKDKLEAMSPEGLVGMLVHVAIQHSEMDMGAKLDSLKAEVIRRLKEKP
jgi:hypothetical protein